MLFILLIDLIGAIDWIALHKLGPESIPMTSQPNPNDGLGLGLGKYDLCNHIPEERFIQKKLCYGYPSLMGAIVTATKQTKLACEVSSFSLKLFGYDQFFIEIGFC